MATWLQRQDAGLFLPFLRGYFRCALRPALVRGMPVYAVLLVTAGLVREALPLHRALAQMPALLSPLAALWCVLLTHVRAPLFGSRQTEYLRALPVPNAVVSLTTLLALVCIDAPWLLFCLASGQLALVAAGAALTAAGHAALGARRWQPVLGVVCLLGLGVVLPIWLLVLPALAIVALAAPLAWTVTTTGRVALRLRFFLPIPWVGIMRSLLTAAILSDPRLVRRGLGLLGLLTAVAALAVRNNDFSARDQVLRTCLVVLAVALPILTPRVATGVLENGWALAWLYDASGASRLTRALAGVVTMLLGGAAFGGLHGLAVALLSRPSLAWPLVPCAAAVGGALAVVALGLAALPFNPRGIDQARPVIGVALAMILAVLLGSDLRVALVALSVCVLAAVVVYALCVARAPEAAGALRE